ncbi:Rib/alpha-like domain-containing protein [Erysipelothrix rhusiopathiae]|nr:Rib/alpha-like domain-containing protein [Erysipelothrix rhusiopathiae]
MYIFKQVKKVYFLSLAALLSIGILLIKPTKISSLESYYSTTNVVRKVSENISYETLGYSKNYNFSDLQFVPEKISDSILESNIINFEMLGKHNIAASTDNWEIRLQIDERIAKYISDIKIDAKVGVIIGRRTFVRMVDTLGRVTNIWKVNYIRANDGLFAGAETTATQIAPNGKITLEKSLKEILNEIGKEGSRNDKLKYRVYLVSHQDNDKIVPGIESTGYFITENNLSNDSENNNDQFKHGSLSVKYEGKNINTADSTGNTGANGALVLDHKITKSMNFSYSISAKGTPWNINFKVDPRLVPYIQGVELHKVFANRVKYDVSYSTGTKVADMSIDNREGNPSYGLSTITDNDLNKLISFSNASPRPIVIRHVLKLTKPLDEVMEELKKQSNVLENESYGEDFIFDAWLSDSNNKNIVGTFGTGFYYLQDIDGDGKVDELETNDKTSQYVGKPTLQDVYDVDQTIKGKVYLHELAGKGNVIQLIDKDRKILDQKEISPLLENGTYKSGYVSFEFKNFDHKKINAKDKLTVRVTSPGFEQPEESETIVKEGPRPIDKRQVELNTVVDAKESVKNNGTLPVDSTYQWKKKPDTTKVTNSTTGIVEVSIGNRTFDVEVEFEVVDSRNEAAKYTPIGKALTTELNVDPNVANAIVNQLELPENTTYAWKEKVDVSTVGVKQGTVLVTYPDGSKDEVVVDVEVFDPRSDAEKFEPVVEKIKTELNNQPSASDGIANKNELPKNTVYTWKEEIDVTTPGIKEGTIVVTYPDGSKEEVTVSVKVVDTRTDAEKNNPTGQKVTTELNGKANPSDGITNKDELPENTVYTWKEEIDVTTPGIKEGTIVVTYPDGSKEEVTVSVEVVDTRTDAEKNNPMGQKVTTELNGKPNASDGIENKQDMPANTTYTWKEEVDTSTSGTKQVAVIVTYPDGSKDEVIVEVEVVDSRTDVDKYTPIGQSIETELNVVPNATDAITNKSDLPENTTYTWKEEIEVTTPGIKSGIVLVTYPDGSVDEVAIEIEVVDTSTDADKHEPMGNNLITKLNVEPNVANAIVNQWELPENTTYAWKEKVDVSTVGVKQGTVLVTYPDGSKDEVVVDVEVFDPRSDAEKFEPVVEKIKTELNNQPSASDGIANKNELPKNTVYTWKEEIDVTTPGIKEGTIVVTYPDGSKEEVTVSVKVVDTRTDAEKNNPTGQKVTTELNGKANPSDGITNKDELPENTVYTWKEEIDVTTPGIKEGTIVVTYPDGSKEEVTVSVEVVDTRTDAEKNNPMGQKVTTELNGKPNASDGIENKQDMPANTTYTWKEEVDTSTSGTKQVAVIVTYPDGSKDEVIVEVEVVDSRTDADKYTPIGQSIETELNVVPNATDAITNKSDLPENTTYTWKEEIEVTTPGIKSGIVLVTYPDGSVDEVAIEIEVVDTSTDADKHEPMGNNLITKLNVEPNVANAIVNQWELPENTTYAWKEKVDVSTVGVKQGTVLVTYPDGSKDEVVVDVEVFDPRSDAEKFEPVVEKIKTELNNQPSASDGIANKNELPKNTVYTWKEEIDVTTPGIKEGTIVVTYPDGSKEEVTVSVEVVDTRTDAEKNNPTGQKVTTELNGKPNPSDGIANKDELPENTVYTWKEEIDVTTPGIKEGTIVITYPDGSKDEVIVEVEVVDSRSDADKYEPIVENETIKTGDKVDLTDNVINLPDLPIGTIVVDKTPENSIDSNKPGTYTGVIEIVYPDGSRDIVRVDVIVEEAQRFEKPSVNMPKSDDSSDMQDNGNSENKVKTTTRSTNTNSNHVLPQTGVSSLNLTLYGSIMVLVGLIAYIARSIRKENENN